MMGLPLPRGVSGRALVGVGRPFVYPHPAMRPAAGAMIPIPGPGQRRGWCRQERQPRPVPEVSFPVRGLSQASTAGIGACPQTNWLRPTAIRRSDGFPASAMRLVELIRFAHGGQEMLGHNHRGLAGFPQVGHALAGSRRHHGRRSFWMRGRRSPDTVTLTVALSV